MSSKREHFTAVINYTLMFIIVIYFGGCKKNTYISSNVSKTEISSNRFWILQAVSTNNDDIAIVIIEEDCGDKMFMNLEKDFDGSLIYNSPNIVDGKLKNKGVYIVKEKGLVYLPAINTNSAVQ